MSSRVRTKFPETSVSQKLPFARIVIIVKILIIVSKRREQHHIIIYCRWFGKFCGINVIGVLVAKWIRKKTTTTDTKKKQKANKLVAVYGRDKYRWCRAGRRCSEGTVVENVDKNHGNHGNLSIAQDLQMGVATVGAFYINLSSTRFIAKAHVLLYRLMCSATESQQNPPISEADGRRRGSNDGKEGCFLPTLSTIAFASTHEVRT